MNNALRFFLRFTKAPFLFGLSVCLVLIFAAYLAKRGPVGAQGGGPPITLQEVDGVPTIFVTRKIIVPNGTLTVGNTNEGTLAYGSGTGDVSGPGSSTDNALTRFDGTGGKTLQNSNWLLSDAGAMDITTISAPANPSAGFQRLYANSSTGKLGCLTSSGTNCFPSSSNLTAPPSQASFTWVNQGGATATDSTTIFVGATQVSGIVLTAPADTGPNLRVLKITAPATPYTYVVGFLYEANNADFYGAGFVWRQASDGKMVTVALESKSGLGVYQLNVNKWTNATTFSANYTSYVPIHLGSIVWVKVTDNGTNRLISTSVDGNSWVQIHSVGRTDFLTADEVGIYVNTQNTGAASIGSFVHWLQS